ncbi:hypothetical protein BCD48_40455 [Pseudofrankia sp. BMG5.36]|nr:hypothetical protein BCD48_40455 [Pseudofrankia sp. BMG5.36]
MRMMAPRTYHADGAQLFRHPNGSAELGVVLEVQRRWDPEKQWIWLLYVAHMTVRLRVRTVLLVYCSDPAVAARYKKLFDPEDRSVPLRPIIFSPLDVPRVVDVEEARTDPVFAVFSVICHGGDADIDDLFPALAAALETVSTETGTSYDDIVRAGLPPDARARWEAYMVKTDGHRFYSDYYRELDARSRADERSRSVLAVLEERGVPVSDAARERILACGDLDRLDTWLRRAITATSVDDVIRD